MIAASTFDFRNLFFVFMCAWLLKDLLLMGRIFVMHCAIWYHLYNLKTVKNTHGGVLILVKLKGWGWVGGKGAWGGVEVN